jgi:hypothetical protein
MMKIRLGIAPALVGISVSVIALGAGSALGAPISKCTTISKPGFYELTRNLTAEGDCLVVAADFVTLDLGGWVIAGTGGTGVGITDQGAPRQGIAVRDGTVTGFDTGVNFFQTSRALVEKVRALDNDEQGIVIGADSIISGNTSFGSIIGITARSGSTISGNIAFGGDFGLTAGPSSVITGNDVGGDVGLNADGGSIVSENAFRGGETGISVGPGSTVNDNTVTGGVSEGIVVGPGSTIRGNTARAEEDGGDAGILANCPSNVIGNTATGYENNLVLSGAGCTNIDNLAP